MDKHKAIAKICINLEEYHSLLQLKEKYIALEEKYKQLLELKGKARSNYKKILY